MAEICLDPIQGFDVELAIHNILGLQSVELTAVRERVHYKQQVAELHIKIVIKAIDLLMHPDKLLPMVEFCFDFRIPIIIMGNDAVLELFNRLLSNLLINTLPYPDEHLTMSIINELYTEQLLIPG